MPPHVYFPNRRPPGKQVSPLLTAWRLFMLWESRRIAALVCVAALGVCCTALMRFNEANAYLGEGRFLLLPMLAVLPILIPLFGSGPGLTDLSGRSYRALQLLPMSSTQRRQSLWLEHFFLTGLAAPVVAGLAVGILPVPWGFKVWFMITLLIWSFIACFYGAVLNYVSNDRDAWTWAVLFCAALCALGAYQWRNSEWPMLVIAQISIVGSCWFIPRMPVRAQVSTIHVGGAQLTPQFEARHVEPRRLFLAPLVRFALVIGAVIVALLAYTKVSVFAAERDNHFRYLYFACGGALLAFPYAERSMRVLPVSSWTWTAGFAVYALGPGALFAVAVFLLAPTWFSWSLAVVVALISLLLFALTSLLYQTWAWLREQDGGGLLGVFSFATFGSFVEAIAKALPLPSTLYLLLGVAVLVVTLLLWIRYRTLWDSRRYARIKREEAIKDTAHPEQDEGAIKVYWVLTIVALFIALIVSTL